MLALIYLILEIGTKFKILGYVFSNKARGILLLYGDCSTLNYNLQCIQTIVEVFNSFRNHISFII